MSLVLLLLGRRTSVGFGLCPLQSEPLVLRSIKLSLQLVALAKEGVGVTLELFELLAIFEKGEEKGAVVIGCIGAVLLAARRLWILRRVALCLRGGGAGGCGFECVHVKSSPSPYSLILGSRCSKQCQVWRFT